MNIVFFGGNKLSTIVLEKLIANDIKPNLIITSPDEPLGRKKVLTPPPLKIKALELKIPVEQPISLKKDLEITEKIKRIKPEIGLVAAYGKIIPEEILNLFPKKTLNLHPSLLPLYRGPSPIQTAILNAETKTGITIIILDPEMDHGPILVQKEFPLNPNDYFPEIYEKIADFGGMLFAETIKLWLEEKIKPQEQEHKKASFCKKFNWLDGEIKPDFETALEIYNKIRALSSEPGTWLKIGQPPIIIKINQAIPLNTNNQSFQKPGLFASRKELFLVGKDLTALKIERLTPASKKEISAKEFLNGYSKFYLNHNLKS